MADHPSVRESLTAALNGNEPEPAEVIAAPEAPVVEPSAEPEVAQEPTAERQRDASGKFLPKETSAAEPPMAPVAAETAAPVEPEPPKETTRVPPSLPAAIKAKFATLEPDVQQAFTKLEESVQTSKAEWGRKGERLNRFDEILGPHLDRWQMNGLDEFSGVQTLLAAQSLLDRNPLDGLLQIARSYGYTPAHLAQAWGLSQTSDPQPQTGQQPGSPDMQAALAPFMQEFRTLQQQFTQTQRNAEQAEVARLAAQIDAFATDPKNLYFNDVQDAVVEIMRSGKAAGRDVSLQDAYDRAVWADPSIRPLLMKASTDSQAAEQAKAAEEARKQAEQAKRERAQAAAVAGGSVVGAPTPGASAPKGTPGSVRDSIRSAMQELGAA